MYECACVCVLCVLVYTDFGCCRSCQLRVRCLEYCLFTLRPPRHYRSPPETCNDDDDCLSTTTMRSERTHTLIFIRTVYGAPYYKNTHSARTHTHTHGNAIAEGKCSNTLTRLKASETTDWPHGKATRWKPVNARKLCYAVLRCAHVWGSTLLVVDIEKRLHTVESMPTKGG